jgi:hypothetical protein
MKQTDVLERYALIGVEQELQQLGARLVELKAMQDKLMGASGTVRMVSSNNGHGRTWTAAQREAVSKRMKRYWAERRKA